MSELNVHPGRNVRKQEFDRFTSDLQLFLEAFSLSHLAQWMARDKGNLSKKLTGIEPITAKDLVDFYGTLSSVIIKLRKGVPAYIIEQDMITADDALKVTPTKNIWEALRLIKEELQKQDAAIKALISRSNRPRKRKNGHRRSH